jgi:hypothetical protein
MVGSLSSPGCLQPGHPQQNGRHERLHLTLRTHTTRPAGENILQQQTKFDDFLEEFNNERPQEALERKCPAEGYTPAVRHYRGLPELDYPTHDQTIHVTNCGCICLRCKKINLLSLAKYRVVRVDEKSGSRAAALQIATSQDYAGLRTSDE